MKKVFVISALILFGIFFVNLAFAQIINPLPGINDFKTLIGKIADGVVIVILPLAGLMILVAGILFVTSAGNPERVGNAKTVLMYAIIGGAIALAAKGLAASLETIFK